MHWSYIDKQSFTRLWPRFKRWVSTVSVIQSHPLLMILADRGTLPWTQACEWRIYFTESHALRRVTTTIMDLKCFSENLADISQPEKLRIQILHAVVHWMLRFFGFPVHFRSILSKNWMPNDNAIVSFNFKNPYKLTHVANFEFLSKNSPTDWRQRSLLTHFPNLVRH